MSERLTEIISSIVHTGEPARRALSRGLIISYLTPEPDTPREQQRWSLSAARFRVWPDDQELKIVFDCLYRAWRHHPTALIYDTSDWVKTAQTLEGRGGSKTTLGTFTIYWRQWPIRDIFSAPAGLQDALRAALARR